ncbi:hypothetical protein [Oenococcus oeni]|uniref:hypothetical protein n=1 Tax=Oenococcus oeni TaxID=1247 RepID=UPI00214A95B2|nr:hypothetical protein [Oenococcus oeni]
MFEIKLMIPPIILALLIVQFNFQKINWFVSSTIILIYLILSFLFSFFEHLEYTRLSAVFYALIFGYFLPLIIFYSNYRKSPFEFYLLMFLSLLPVVISIYDYQLAIIISNNKENRDSDSRGLRRDLIFFSSDYGVTFFAVAGAILFGFLPWTSFLIFFSLFSVFNNILKFVARPFLKSTAILALQNYFIISFSLIIGILLGIIIKV